MGVNLLYICTFAISLHTNVTFVENLIIVLWQMQFYKVNTTMVIRPLDDPA